LQPFFFNGLKKELCFSNTAWSISPRNPIRAGAETAYSIHTLLVLGHRLRVVSRGARVLPD